MQPQIKRARLDPATVAAVCQLFRLPRELLELVAAFFSRSEAVPVLVVNSTLHEIFAERIWRRLDTYKWSTPVEPLSRYGHLVRRIRITASIPESFDLAAALPNVTHLWISLSQLAEVVKMSQGKCFERLSWLGTWFDYRNVYAIDYSKEIEPTVNWIDSRLEAEAGLETVQWELAESDDDDMELSRKILYQLQSNGKLSRIHFSIDDNMLDFGDTEISDTENADLDDLEKASFNKAIPHCLVDWTVRSDTYNCAAYRFGEILDTIPSAERQQFQFPALKKLGIGTCCDSGNIVYSDFNFGKLFPSVRDLTLETNLSSCTYGRDDSLNTILVHPWLSVRKLDICGEFIVEDIVPHLSALSNVEELLLDWEITGSYDGLEIEVDSGVLDLCELNRALPKLVRLKANRQHVASTPQQPQQQQQQQQQQQFRYLRYVSFERLRMTSSAISALIRAPLLTDICLKHVDFTYDVFVGSSDDEEVEDGEDENKEEEEDDDGDVDGEVNHQQDSASKHDFLTGVTNPAVRSMYIQTYSFRWITNCEDFIRAMLKCFVRLGVCTIQSGDKEALTNLITEFSNVKFKHIK
ncbi:hypothetical protein GQ42DRAFT_63384 [Ramicandelaber brevisporus]|nr:hypothetical protein GQ42DRAFT_63384 [Ramicandelaber brevisporus]